MTGYTVLAVGAPALLAERVLVSQSTRLVGFAWCIYECFRYAQLIRKRARLGLALPSLAHRFRLWGVACSAQFTGALIMLLSTVVPIPLSANYLIQSPLAAAAVICIGLAFFPPANYIRWISADDSRPA